MKKPEEKAQREKLNRGTLRLDGGAEELELRSGGLAKGPIGRAVAWLQVGWHPALRCGKHGTESRVAASCGCYGNGAV